MANHGRCGGFPEVIAKALTDKEIYMVCCPIIIGDALIMQKAIKLIKGSIGVNAITEIQYAQCRFGYVDVVDVHCLDEQSVIAGQKSSACGKASVEYVIKAAQLAMQDDIDALVTAPINKESTRQAGYGELGHLELLARYTNSTEYATMLVSDPLRVVHLTTHYSLRKALDFVTQDRIISRLELIAKSFKSWGINNPCIGVAALNPHGGEGGILGSEEIEEITPAIKYAQKLGINAQGPYPADTIFNRALKGEFDVILAMYHDQGHIPIKVYGFEKSLSIALGLPFIRTSVDHGTAFDIAWKGVADAESMKEAIKIAVKLCNEKKL